MLAPQCDVHFPKPFEQILEKSDKKVQDTRFVQSAVKRNVNALKIIMRVNNVTLVWCLLQGLDATKYSIVVMLTLIYKLICIFVLHEIVKPACCSSF